MVGWSKAASSSIESKVADLAAAIGERGIAGAVQRWTTPYTKDGGLDLVAWKSFPDGWGGRPVCLVQCASGADWPEKLHTPDIATWRKLIDFSTEPRRGLAMPFAPEENTFRLKSNKDLLMFLLDRHRILYPGRRDGSGFPSANLRARLTQLDSFANSRLPGGHGLVERVSMFRFVDLFAGLGGFHIAAESLGGKCVFACRDESKVANRYIAKTSRSRYAGDINEVKVKTVPRHNLLCRVPLPALFPRPATSVASAILCGEPCFIKYWKFSSTTAQSTWFWKM